MAKRPAQGRGSGGRVTPKARPPGGSVPRPSGRGRVTDTPARPPAGAPEDPAPRRRSLTVAGLLNPGRAAGVPPAERVRPWWGFGDVVLWYLIGRIGAQLVMEFAAVQGGYRQATGGRGSRVGEGIGRLTSRGRLEVTRTLADMPLWLSQVVILLPMWASFIGGAVYATVHKGFGPVRDLKISFRPVDVPVGLAVGMFGQLVLTPALYWVLFRFTGEQDVSASARGITDKATSPALVVLLFLTVGIVAPVAEELFFRGLALQSLIRRFDPAWALVLSSAFFAAVHLSPLLFVALMPFAMLLAGLVLYFGRLGPAIVAHITFNLVTATLLVFEPDLPLPW
jgi:membrane protease YdiL (CAAX protease family)